VCGKLVGTKKTGGRGEKCVVRAWRHNTVKKNKSNWIIIFLKFFGKKIFKFWSVSTSNLVVSTDDSLWKKRYYKLK